MSAYRMVLTAAGVGLAALAASAQPMAPTPSTVFGGGLPEPAERPSALVGKAPPMPPASAPLFGSKPAGSSLPSVEGVMQAGGNGSRFGGGLMQAQLYTPPDPAAGAMPVTDALTQPPGLVQNGVVSSPWCGPDGCGPVGANGFVTYEPYIRTGPNVIGGGGEFTRVLYTGWTVQGGARTLLFDTSGEAAWAIDLGLGVTRNGGRRLDRPIDITANSLRFGTPDQDFDFPLGVRGLTRWSFNYAIGRDWWLNGPGVVGQENDGNLRAGVDVGGRWGTAHVDFEPVGDPGGYRRRQKVFQSAVVGGQLNWEKPLGGYTLLLGGRVEWSYNWTNLIPPNDGEFRDINIMLTAGIRF